MNMHVHFMGMYMLNGYFGVLDCSQWNSRYTNIIKPQCEGCFYHSHCLAWAQNC